MAGKKRIFIADDDEAVLISLKNLLLLSDFEVRATSDARTIVASVKEFKPQVILLDLLMPDLGGFEVCELLEQDPMTKGIPIIVVSAIGYYKDIKEIVRKKNPRGVVDCVAKPYNFKKLLAIIEKAMGAV